MIVSVYQLVESVYSEEVEDAVRVLGTYLDREVAQAARREILWNQREVALARSAARLAEAREGLSSAPVSPALTAFFEQRQAFINNSYDPRAGKAVKAKAASLGIDLATPDWARTIARSEADLAALSDFEAFVARSDEPHIVTRLLG